MLSKKWLTAGAMVLTLSAALLAGCGGGDKKPAAPAAKDAK